MSISIPSSKFTILKGEFALGLALNHIIANRKVYTVGIPSKG